MAIPLLSGCTDAQLEKYVSEFNAVVVEARVAIRSQYQKANDIQRALYVDQVRYNPGTKLEVYADDNDTDPTGLVKYYSDEFVQVRLEAIDALASYTEGLAALALSDTPDRAKQALVQTGERLNTISKNLSTVTNGDSLKVSQFSTPIAQLVSIVAREVLDFVKYREVRKSVRGSKEIVDKLCTRLINDLNGMVRIDQSTVATENTSDQLALFNNTDKLKNGTPFDRERNALLDDAQKTGKLRADIAANNAVVFVQRIQSVHNELVDYIDPSEDAEESKQLSNSKKSKGSGFGLKSKKKDVESQSASNELAKDHATASRQLKSSFAELDSNKKAKLANYVIQELGALKGDLHLMRSGGK